MQASLGLIVDQDNEARNPRNADMLAIA